MDDTVIFKPQLAVDAVLDKLRFPQLASPKLDGIRAIVRGGVVYSRSNKPIPNLAVQEKFSCAKYDKHDGELIFGEPTSKSVYRDTVSVVMSIDKPATGVRFFTFDHIGTLTDPYTSRIRHLKSSSHAPGHEKKMIHSLAELLAYEEECLELGYEGLILRDPDAPYKMGRSTVNEGYLLKLKRFSDFEATVIGFEERMENTNAKQVNELGRSKRSSHAAGKVGRGDLGAILLRTAEGVDFACGTGFDDAERRTVWDNRDNYLGRLARVKSFDIGVKTKPRHPVFLGWRSRDDI